MVELRLQDVDLRLDEIALRLRHQETRRQSGFEAPLLDGEPLLGQILAGAGRVDPFGRALHLARGLADGLGDATFEAGDAVRCLTALDFRARQPGLLEVPADRLAERHADTPRRVVVAEHLAEDIAEAALQTAGDFAGKRTRADQLRAAGAAGAVRRFEAVRPAAAGCS